MDDVTTDKQQLIMDTAIRLFDRYGFDKTSINDITDAAGIGKGTFYYYFDSKEDLYLSIVKAAAERDLAGTEAKVNACQTIPEKLMAFALAPIDWMTCNALVYFRFMVENQNVFLKKMTSLKKKAKAERADFMRKILVDAQEAGVIRKGIDIDRLLGLFFEQFAIFGQEAILRGSLQESVDEFREDMKFIIDIALFGIMEKKS